MALEHVAQREHSMLCTRLLHEAEHGVQHNDGAYCDRLDVLTDQSRHDGSAEQETDERIGELSESDGRVPGPRRATDSIRADSREPILRLVLCEAVLEIGPELASYMLDGSGVRSVPRLHGQITRAAAK
jgi:hypothetical protein